jgi:mono/diheme cytochrome c family protein
VRTIDYRNFCYIEGCAVLDLVVLATLIAIAASLAWASDRAWRAKNRFLKWGGMSLAAFLSAAVSLIAVITVVGLFKLNARSAPVADLTVAGTSEQIQRGRAISDSFCSRCHSKTGMLTDGLDLGKDLPIPIGSFVSSYLTPAVRLRRWSDGEIFRAVRNGVDRDGRWLIVISYNNSGRLSDDDTKAVIAYIRSVPATGAQTGNPADHLSPWAW